MNLRRVVVAACGVLALAGAVYGFQKPFRLYPSFEPLDDVSLPSDWNEKTEWVFARLMYPNHPNAWLASAFFRFRGAHDWREGATSWTQDYPRADRHFAAALRRLTRINVRSVEQPNSPDDLDDFYNWPWMAAGEMGDWKLTDAQVKTVREYLLRGGFLMLDDFWGPEEFDRFNETMKAIFPDRPVVDIAKTDNVFHIVYDLNDLVQVPGKWCIPAYQQQCQIRARGTTAHWMGVYDDKNRLMVAISFNSDLGDAWEWADSAEYPEELAAFGLRIAVNDVVYSMTH